MFYEDEEDSGEKGGSHSVGGSMSLAGTRKAKLNQIRNKAERRRRGGLQAGGDLTFSDMVHLLLLISTDTLGMITASPTPKSAKSSVFEKPNFPSTSVSGRSVSSSVISVTKPKSTWDVSSVNSGASGSQDIVSKIMAAGSTATRASSTGPSYDVLHSDVKNLAVSNSDDEYGSSSEIPTIVHAFQEKQSHAEMPLTPTQRKMMEQGISDSFDPTSSTAREDSNLQPASLYDIRKFCNNPPDPGVLVECRIERESQKLFTRYNMYLENGRRFILAAKLRKKVPASDYLISLDRDDLERSSGNYMGKVKSNITGTEFNIYNRGENPKKLKKMGAGVGLVAREQVGLVKYEANPWGVNGPRKMTVWVPDIGAFKPGEAETELTLSKRVSKGETDGLFGMRNREPYYSAVSKEYVLNFHGRVTMSSTRNFQLIDRNGDNKRAEVIMQFGRMDNDVFTLDYRWPMSAVQALGIALSSLDRKLGLIRG